LKLLQYVNKLALLSSFPFSFLLRATHIYSAQAFNGLNYNKKQSNATELQHENPKPSAAS